jgi:hypothetical protein
MNMEHLTPYLEGMDARRPDLLAEHMSEAVVIKSPFLSTPFVGKAVAMGVLSVLLTTVDEFETTAVITGDKRAAVMLRIRLGDAEVTGIDDMEIDDDGLITSMTVHWRPLDQIVAIPQKLAPLVGVPALQLVERDAA